MRTIHMVGVDIGGTTTRIGSFTPDTFPRFRLLARFPTATHYPEECARITAVVQAEQTLPQSIGISFGGRITQDGASVAPAPNLPDYVGKPLRNELTATLGCPVRLGHDTVCGLLAERQFGSLQGQARCAYVTLSTGTGGAVYLGQGERGMLLSIEFAHQILAANPRVCLCGQVGCLETYTGGKQIALRMGMPAEQITDLAFWDEVADKLALGLVNLAHLTRVEHIAISGGIALHRPHLLPAIQMRVDATLRGLSLKLVPAALGDDAPLVGAAWLPQVEAGLIMH